MLNDAILPPKINSRAGKLYAWTIYLFFFYLSYKKNKFKRPISRNLDLNSKKIAFI